jgi:CheY-like chemotaxis protein
MDVQMPEMDGCEATKAIRKLERERGGHTPILAMTAAVMKEEVDKSYAAGMDGCVFKPIDPDQLYRTLDAYAPATADDTSPGEIKALEFEATAGHSGEDLVMNIDEARLRIPGGQGEVNEMARLLSEQCSQLLAEIREGIAERDVILIKRNLHTLQGSASIFDAHPVMAAAQQLSKIIGAENFDGAVESLAHLEQEVHRLSASLASYIEANPG